MIHEMIKWLLCLGLAVSVVGVVRGQLPPPTTMPSGRPAFENPHETVRARVVAMLEGCGYKPTLETAETGDIKHHITIKKDGWTFPVIVGLSPSGRKVWMFTTVKRFGAGEEVPADRLLELLDVHKLIGTGHFVYLKESREIRYATVYDSRALTAADMQHELTEFATNLQKMRNLWDFTAEVRR